VAGEEKVCATLDEAAVRKMQVSQLKTELRARSLTVSGTKPALVERLLQHLREQAMAAMTASVVESAKRQAPSPAEEQPPEKIAAIEEKLTAEQRATIEKKRIAAIELRRAKEAEAVAAAAAAEAPAAATTNPATTPAGDGDLAYFPPGLWRDALQAEFAKPYFVSLLKFLKAERQSKKILPPPEDVFTAFRCTPLDKVKVVIIGQDPYFNPGEAHGLSFSVRPGVKIPPSLSRIFTVLEKTIPNFKRPKSGYLLKWAERGVFMLNATLTVEQGKPNSHSKAGWAQFTDAVIGVLNSHCTGLVYMLWGQNAQAKGKLVDASKNHILVAPHPSPMSGSQWLSCTHFADANRLLIADGKEPIDWTL